MPQLPQAPGIDVDKLAGTFRRVSQSYKFLFFRAILDGLAAGERQTMSYADIVLRMCEGAWWPTRRYRLLIAPMGVRDELTRMMDRIGDDLLEEFSSERLKAVIGPHVTEQGAKGFLRRVPNRFLQPWLQDMYAQIGDNEFDKFVQGYSRNLRDKRGMPYAIRKDNMGIDLAPAWADYLLANLPIVRGWADLEWLSWVQARNPNVPVTLEKLGPPSDRIALTEQHAFLRCALAGESMACIYTGEPVRATSMSLDHFVPRSYAGHDRIWNLVPMAGARNSSKGARLPRPEYVSKLAAFHHAVIHLTDPANTPRWRRFAEEYASDLRVAPEGLADLDVLTAAFAGTVQPMLMTAARMGFPTGWP